MKRLSARPEEADTPPLPDPALQLQRKVWRARAVLAVDRLWPAVWLPLAVAGVFVLLSLVGVWQFLSPEMHRNALWAFGAALLVSFVPLARVSWPTREEALRRLEAVAGLPHRPASSYGDQLSGAQSPLSTRLWEAHRQRTALLFTRLRAGWPNPRIDRLDPFALRALLLLLLAAAYAAQYGNAGERIWAGLTPAPQTLTGSARLDAWITPPVYTGKPPVMLVDGARQPGAEAQAARQFTVPQNSALTVRINHADASRFAVRVIPQSGGAKTLAPVGTANSEGSAEFKETLTTTGIVELRDSGETVARWPVAVIEDTPPRIVLTEPPGEAQRGSLRLRYKVEDDYGVVSAEALVERADVPAEDAEDGLPPPFAPVKRLGKAPQIPLVLPRANTKQGEGQTYRNLASHHWAGLPVTVTLEARDQAGQNGRSAVFSITLPERSFAKPLARALIEQRKKLVDRPDLKSNVADALDALTIAPEIFVHDFSVYLGMRSAYWRVKQANDDTALENAADLLWSVAVRIEDGDLSDSEQQLRNAQEQLMRALQENASDEEIKRLTDELRTALNRFLDDLRERGQASQEFDPRNMSGDARAVTPQDLDKMLKQIEDLARTGSKDAARQLLSELRDMLENAQTSSQAGASHREMKNTLDGLSDIISKQQRLLDETYRAQRKEQQPGVYEDFDDALGGEDRWNPQDFGQGAEPQPDGKKPGDGKGQNAQQYGELEQKQKGLQQQLRQFMDKLKGMGATSPEQLDGAGQAMGNAGDALGERNSARATEQQTRALEKLRQGAKSLAEQMMSGNGNGGSRGMGQNNRDPLGRQMPGRGLDTGDSVKVPEEGDLLRAREILEELRRRLGERARSPSELDYIERLIERF